MEKKMCSWRILMLVYSVFIIVEAKTTHQKREIASICDPVYNNTNKVQCYCVKESRETGKIKSADCYLTSEGVQLDDQSWDGFDILQGATKLILTNTRGVILKYIPTNGLKYMDALLKLDIKYGIIDKVQAFAFANLSFVEEIILRDNQVEVLQKYAFAHHRDLMILSLDQNNIVEINRDVFVDLPALDKLYLTNNKITTIHDKAFIHLANLRELEIDRNNLFSLNSETFSGLKRLQKLDLSSNSLEVIGDNTFLPLVNLRSLNLDSNKIQMLDDNAFHGLTKLQSLSLAHNKLSEINNVKVFEGLLSLTSLNLKENHIHELKPEVFAPILKNFYNINSNLDIEDNDFPCDCRLDWFLPIINNTQNTHLKLALENLKCLPDAALRELWSNSEEADKNLGQIFEEEESQAQGTDYEYYDVSQLNGTLFYIDVRDLLNCSKKYHTRNNKIFEENITQKPITTKTTENAKTVVSTKVSSSLADVYTTTSKPVTIDFVVTKKANELFDTTLKDIAATKAPITKEYVNNKLENEITMEKTKTQYTTSRLVTVSAKPSEDKSIYEENMAADEAKPDKIAHRSIPDNIKNSPFKTNNAFINTNSVTVFIVIISFRFFY